MGVLLLVLAAEQWHARSDSSVPAWMQAIDSLTVVKAAGLGALLSGVNPKNLLLCLSAGVVIGSAGLSAGGDLVAIAVFTLLFLTGLFEKLPEATLAAVVIAAVIELLDLRNALAHKRIDFRIARSVAQFGQVLGSAEAGDTPIGIYPTVAAAAADLPEHPPGELTPTSESARALVRPVVEMTRSSPWAARASGEFIRGG